MSGFWQIEPDEGSPATQKTEVFVGYSEDTLYVGVICYDKEPDRIIVTDSRRDSSLAETDSFQFIIDGLKDGQNGLIFGTNPAGIEYDAQVTKEGTGSFGSSGGEFNLNWDTSWQVKTRIDETGWQAEFAIPFKSLRYGAGPVQTWGMNFQRNIRRNNEVSFWSPLSRQHNLHRVSEAGSVTDIQPPHQRSLKFTPYGVGKRSKGGSLKSDTDYEFGFDLKYSITSSLTLDATYNTDFAQVEVDEFQVNLDRFSLFLPEQRPFFLENAGQFSVGVPEQTELFFSRRIGIGPGGVQIPIDGGVRLSGKIGQNTNVGLLQMRSEAVRGVAPENDYTVARVSYELGNRSSIGGIIVNRKGDGSVIGDDDDDYNRTYGIDGKWGIGEYMTLSGFAAKTKTPGLSGRDHAFRLRNDYNSKNWTMHAAYAQVGENFNPEVGFLSRSGYKHLSLFALRRIRPDDLWGLHELRPHIAYFGYWNFDGFWETGFMHVDNHWEWESGFEMHTGVNFLHEGVATPFEIVSGVTVQPGSYDDSELAFVVWTDPSAPLNFSLNAKHGGLFGGDRTQLIPAVKYRIGETFSSELSWIHNDVDLDGGDFKVGVGRLRLTYSFTPKMSIQALVQYNERDDLLSTNFRFAWLTSADTGLYVVYNEVDDRDGFVKPRKEFIIKYSHILDLM
ncbi:MAG: carbohydrate binding family 9 domain-containing protein [Gammaproteobacteria bacterium]|nr:carbohydrate binding family 9 domain-containing protein [Gammaproteobacteria bacterium]MBT4493499.1 carbohydrate binding family 9 domain-containing protein [Gammaproteobacteria bacterium]MBT7370126.1 carbohydrate binding family 9 domain-containing protein [Gammaproteobacteria bacterium]